MDSREVAQIARQANAIGNSHGVFCTYGIDAGKFKWIFYRKNPVANIRLGKTGDPKRVVKMMEKFITCIP